MNQIVPGVGTTERTSKVASDGIMCLAFPLKCVEDLMGSDVPTI